MVGGSDDGAINWRMYRLFAEASGRWATPQWMMGVDTRPRWVNHAYKELTRERISFNMIDKP